MKRKIFICADRRDHEWCKRLLSHFPSNGRSEAGESERDLLLSLTVDRFETVEQTTDADIALLLLSPDFLASHRIISAELPALVEQFQRDGFPVVALLVRACVWHAVPALSHFPLYPADRVPLANIDERAVAERMAEFVDLVGRTIVNREKGKRRQQVTLKELADINHMSRRSPVSAGGPGGRMEPVWQESTSLETLERKLEQARQEGDGETQTNLLNDIAGKYRLYGDYNRALQYLEKMLELTKRMGDKKGLASSLNNIATIYQARGDYAAALSYLEQSLAIQREIGDKEGEGTTLNNLAATAYATGDYDAALSFLEQSLTIVREIGDKAGERTTLHNMAVNAYQQDDVETYLKYETEAYQIALDINDAMGIYIVGRDLGDELVKMGKKKEGLAMLHRSLEIGQKAGYPDVSVVEAYIEKAGID